MSDTCNIKLLRQIIDDVRSVDFEPDAPVLMQEGFELAVLEFEEIIDLIEAGQYTEEV
jgi:hypothetical protein